MITPQLTFLKLGGSLITDKTRAYTARLDLIADLVEQIAQAKKEDPGLPLVLGHGSGSFGHTAAKEYATRQGIASPPRRPPSGSQEGARIDSAEYWHGFAEVCFQASALNRLVMEALHAAQLAAVALAPVAAVTAENGELSDWDVAPLEAALNAGLLPVIYGDVVFDRARGGTILSTEDLFGHLARRLRPDRILLAGLEQGVWADFPRRESLVEQITPASVDKMDGSLGASQGADVTGGMESKVHQMLALVQASPGVHVRIFSGQESGNVLRALRGEAVGTAIRAD